MGLDEYNRKRDFARTSEPKAAKAQYEAGFSFVVQMHAARQLHYDFRLELDGVLLSWAVPKGPSLDPAVKRLAMQTEDHPIEYGTFEGTIPKGEYGGGTVAVWDHGHWVPEGDPREAYERGRLTFVLEGQRLRGSWHLVRTRGPAGRARDSKKAWLLFKGTDDEARPGSDSSIVDEHRTSAMSGRSLEQIERDPDRVWHSNREDGVKAELPDVATSKATPSAALPGFVAPQLATLSAEVPRGGDWVHEIKLDGYRLLARLDHGKVQLFTRKGNDWTDRMPSLARALAALPIEGALLDGELVVFAESGAASFQRLQNSLSVGKDDACVYCAFDVLYLQGHDVRKLPLIERKELLRTALAAVGALEGRIRYNDHFEGSGELFLSKVCELGLEGMISKQKNAPYSSRRGRHWLKIKCMKRQEFVVGGFTEPAGARTHFGALLLGQYDAQGRLRYAGKVGTGFSDQSLAELHARLRPLERKQQPFEPALRGAEARDVHFLEPTLVAEITFAERTEEGLVRHSVFHGLRDDKPASEVTAEQVANASEGALDDDSDDDDAQDEPLAAASQPAHAPANRKRSSSNANMEAADAAESAPKAKRKRGGAEAKADAAHASESPPRRKRGGGKIDADVDVDAADASEPVPKRKRSGGKAEANAADSSQPARKRSAAKADADVDAADASELARKRKRSAANADTDEDAAEASEPARKRKRSAAKADADEDAADSSEPARKRKRSAAKADADVDAADASEPARNHKRGAAKTDADEDAADASEPAPKRKRGSRPAEQAEPEEHAGESASERYPLPVPPEVSKVRLTHPERVLFPDDGITKAELALYYAQVAKWMLPHTGHRPLMLVRCPQGLAGDCFHQKHPSPGVPDSVQRPRIREKNSMLQSMAITDAAGLLGLVQVGGLEIHSWGSRIEHVEAPDQLVFDLDPDEGLPWPRMIEAAQRVRAALGHLGLPAFLKTTGGKGLHVVVPIAPELEWEQAKAFCKGLVDTLVRAEPDKYLANMSKARRSGKVFLDYLRNGRGATAVCAYSTRAKPGAPVSVPIRWDELTPELRSDHFRMRDVPRRLAKLRHDPWRDFEQQRKPISSTLLRAVGVK